MESKLRQTWIIITSKVLNYAYNCNGEMFECNVTWATICSNCGSEQPTKD